MYLSKRLKAEEAAAIGLITQAAAPEKWKKKQLNLQHRLLKVLLKQSA